MNGNSFMSTILRSPLHGMLSGSTMLITVMGRKSGQPITTPVNYVRDGEELWVISKRDRKWWRNLKGGGEVKILLRGKEITAHAELVLDEPCVTDGLKAYIHGLPMTAKALGIRMENGQPDQEGLSQAVHDWLLIRVKVS